MTDTLSKEAVADQVAQMREEADAIDPNCASCGSGRRLPLRMAPFTKNSEILVCAVCLERRQKLRANADRLEQRARATQRDSA